MKRKIALVTGGASGIGSAIARQLASDGAYVVVNDIDSAAAAETAADIGGAAAVFDVAESAAFDTAVDDIVALHGSIDILVNNAGILGIDPQYVQRAVAALMAKAEGAPPEPVRATTSLDDATFDRMIKVHLYGTFHGIRAALRHMEPVRQGTIVNVASIAGLRGFPATPHYAAAKAAIIGLTKSVGIEVAPLGIRVNAVAPGYVDTPRLDVPGRPDLGELGRSGVIGRIGAGRLGRPEEIAAAVAFLASERASFCFGDILTATGADLGE